MSQIKTGNLTHDTTLALSEMNHQVSVGASGATAATIKTADIAYYRAALASATANSCGQTQFLAALRELTGGA